MVASVGRSRRSILRINRRVSLSSLSGEADAGPEASFASSTLATSRPPSLPSWCLSSSEIYNRQSGMPFANAEIVYIFFLLRFNVFLGICHCICRTQVPPKKKLWVVRILLRISRHLCVPRISPHSPRWRNNPASPASLPILWGDRVDHGLGPRKPLVKAEQNVTFVQGPKNTKTRKSTYNSLHCFKAW